jgi:hypothetical protein
MAVLYSTFIYVCQRVSPSPTPPIRGDACEIWQAGEQARHKDGGAGVERCAPVTVYIYFSLFLSAYASLFVPLVILSASQLIRKGMWRLLRFSPWAVVEVMSKEGVRPFGK